MKRLLYLLAALLILFSAAGCSMSNGDYDLTPYGTIREYKVHYLDGNPNCEKCGTELEFILNLRSGKNRCPKCGTDNMKAGHFGFYD